MIILSAGGAESMMLSARAESITRILSGCHTESAAEGRAAVACLVFVCYVTCVCDDVNLSIFWDYIQ